MPLPLYIKHEDKLAAQGSGFCDDISRTDNLKLLREDPDSRLIVYCTASQSLTMLSMLIVVRHVILV